MFSAIARREDAMKQAAPPEHPSITREQAVLNEAEHRRQICHQSLEDLPPESLRDVARGLGRERTRQRGPVVGRARPAYGAPPPPPPPPERPPPPPRQQTPEPPTAESPARAAMSGVASGAAPPVWQEESEDESEDLEPEPAKFVRKYEKSAMNTKLTRRLQDRIRELKTDEQAYIAFQERITEVLASLPPPPKPPPKPRLSEMTPHQREAKRLLQLGERRRRADAAAKRRDELGPRRRPARSRTNLAAPGAQDEAQEAEALEAMEAPPAPELPEHPQTPAWGDEHFADAGPAEHSFKSAQSDRMGDTPHSRYRRRVSLKDRIGAAEGARLTARPKLTTKHHRTSGSMAAYMAEVSAATGGGDSGYGFGDTDSEDSSSRRTAGYSHRRRRKHLAATLSKMRG